MESLAAIGNDVRIIYHHRPDNAAGRVERFNFSRRTACLAPVQRVQAKGAAFGRGHPHDGRREPCWIVNDARV